MERSALGLAGGLVLVLVLVHAPAAVAGAAQTGPAAVAGAAQSGLAGGAGAAQSGPAVAPPAAAVDGPLRVDVGRFAADGLAGWQPKSFRGETQYGLREGALCAESRAAGSGLYRELRIDLARTPLLRWRWRLDRALPPGDERAKQGDDYAARLYVVFSGGVLFWRTRAINYVWSSSQPPGAAWPNAFTANARMLALRGPEAPAGAWLEEARDVRADYREAFGEEPPAADAVAVMTDTDNALGHAAACYAEIRFEAAP